MTDLSAVIQQQIEQLEKERKILQEQFGRLPSFKKKNEEDKADETDEGSEKPTFLCDGYLPSRLWARADKSIQKFRELLLQEEESHGNKIQGHLETLVRFTLPPDREVRLAEVQRDEKVSLAEIAKAEKDHQIVTAKDEKIRLAELANEEHLRQLKAANEEKIRLAELAKEEKVQLAELAQKEKIQLRELANDSQQKQKDEKLTLAELAKDEKVRLEELKLDEIRFVEGTRKDLDIKLAELEMPVKRLNATRDATIEERKSSEKKMLAILKHIELVATMAHRFKGKAGEKTNSSLGIESMGNPPEYGFGDVESTIQLVERLSSLLEFGGESMENTATTASVATEPEAESIEPPVDTPESGTSDEHPSDPPAEPSDPPAEPSDPPAESSDPPAEHCDPPAEPCDPPEENITLYTAIQKQMDVLEKERKVIKDYIIALSLDPTHYNELLQEEQPRAQNAPGLLLSQIRFISSVEQQLQLVQIHSEERVQLAKTTGNVLIRLAETAKGEEVQLGKYEKGKRDSESRRAELEAELQIEMIKSEERASLANLKHIKSMSMIDKVAASRFMVPQSTEHEIPESFAKELSSSVDSGYEPREIRESSLV
ncbi:hypothetical protein BGX27_001447 [Mortierella sp. AM989]|nr:hypothetical protein BGX27_001447 [Mortierella sp. AM989]